MYPKTICILSVILCFLFNIDHLCAQNVGIGTTTPEGKLHIKGTENVHQLIIDADTTPPLPYKALIQLRNYQGRNLLAINSNDSSNIFVGMWAGSVITTGYDNSFFATDAGARNTSGIGNTALGRKALGNNISGGLNTAVGRSALYWNQSDYNTAIGGNALLFNNTGEKNTAMGAYSLNNTNASSLNTAIGFQAGYTQNNGSNNIFIGANADANAAGLTNAIAIGNGTIVTASNTARFGNVAVDSYGGWNDWTNVSDGRFKRNINANVPGLNFITRLRPVTYTLDATGIDLFLHRSTKRGDPANDENGVYRSALLDKGKIVQTGFIAQEVESVSKEIGFDFSGVDAPKNNTDLYGLRYASFVVPLVKAVQELSSENEALKLQLKNLERTIEKMQQAILDIQKSGSAKK